MSSPSQAVVQQWLEQLCRLISGIQSAIVIENGAEQSAGRMLVRWPEDEEPSKTLLKVALKAVETRRQLIVPADAKKELTADLMALPLLSDGQPMGSVAIRLSARPAQKQKAAMQALQWSLRWLKLLMEQANRSHTTGTQWVERLTRKSLSPASIAELLAEQFTCDRVTLAMGDGRRLEILATQPRVEIKRETGLVRTFKEAMFEAMDQHALLHYPPTAANSDLVMHCQQNLAEEVGQATLCSIPLVATDKPVGALLLERHRQQPFTEQEQAECQQAAGLVGLLLYHRQQDKRPLTGLMWERLQLQFRQLLGPKGLWLKVAVLVITLSIALLALIDGDYRIDARANLEGRIQRMITSPFDGYLKQAPVKAGDIVAEGALLCQLDDKDLQLEQAKWRTELAKLGKEQREALATHERAKVAILQAQQQQAQAELELVEKKLARSRITAPLHGVIVSGDLSQSLGAPLKRGEELFKIAPLESYRVMLQVDELDIGDVQIGQAGVLILAGYPQLEHTFQVKRILPLSSAVEGRYLFTLEAELDESNEMLRPGLQGIAKIDAGEHSLLWLVSHRLIDWLRLQLWRWWG
ncbi:MAG: HlyD family efflux transporter periplasmic adaptor subunit [Candidatus Thiodiazotropha sp. (ex Lucinoma borealis)]|nr:HlyD family efflux transporter periplasmic adaptor subunit [Candidatus Thiodiazotropha sp. (ex Lucinoma borealis)]MCU7873086.1 HlyD family efflux transporter periplasmic adaptor subunit [Candidatus Thiodiazotropha sp. (ex Lucinoma borealis)]